MSAKYSKEVEGGKALEKGNPIPAVPVVIGSADQTRGRGGGRGLWGRRGPAAASHAARPACRPQDPLKHYYKE